MYHSAPRIWRANFTQQCLHSTGTEGAGENCSQLQLHSGLFHSPIRNWVVLPGRTAQQTKKSIEDNRAAQWKSRNHPGMIFSGRTKKGTESSDTANNCNDSPSFE